VAKKPASGGRVTATAASVKAKPAKAAGVVAKPKTPVRTTVASSLPKANAGKTNGNGTAHKAVTGKTPVAVKPAAAIKAAPAKASAPAAAKAKSADLKRPELPPRPIPEAVPTNGKPRKNQAGLSPKELEHYRDLLLEKRRELVGDMYSMESEALRTSGGTNLSSLPMHMADMGTDNYEQEFTLGLVEKDRGLLREINAALAKIQNGTFGICEGTGKPIGKPRLEAQPWARHSIEYARQMQRPMGMGMGRVG
jgi:RNA polymerase-binding protein DksA